MIKTELVYDVDNECYLFLDENTAVICAAFMEREFCLAAINLPDFLTVELHDSEQPNSLKLHFATHTNVFVKDVWLYDLSFGLFWFLEERDMLYKDFYCVFSNTETGEVLKHATS